MLIKVFGLWLLSSNISHLEVRNDPFLNSYARGKCHIVMIEEKRINTRLSKCDVVSAIINEEIKKGELSNGR